ncbi:hypothetical protein D3C85_1732180 [compost metagenome]
MYDLNGFDQGKAVFDFLWAIVIFKLDISNQQIIRLAIADGIFDPGEGMITIIHIFGIMNSQVVQGFLH